MQLKDIATFVATFLLFTATIFHLESYPINNIISPTFLIFLGISITYSAGISTITLYLWRKNLRTGLIAVAGLILYFVLSKDFPEVYYGLSNSINFIGTVLGLLSVNIIFSAAEYMYKNYEETKQNLRETRFIYALTGGWLHLVFGFCLAILTYGPEHINEFFFSLRFLTGFTGTFLLAALPIYLYLEGKEKLPAIITGVWIGWGVLSFMLEFDDLPVSSFWPAPEFMIPPAPGYLFSSYLPLSLIIIYVAIRRADLNSYREKLQKYL